MHVAHVLKATGIAGSENHLLVLLPGLRQRGLQVSVLLLENPDHPVDNLVSEFASQGLTVHRIPIRRHLDLETFRALRSQLHAIRPDIVHTHLIHGDLYGLIAAHRAGINHAVSSRHADDPFRRRWAIKTLNRYAHRYADRVIAISQAVRDFVVSVENIPADKVEVIRYGLAASASALDRQAARARLELDGSGLVIGFFGRLIDQKGVAVLLQAWSAVSASHPQARLVIIGDGPLRAELEAQAARLHLTASVCFMGWVEQASRYMPACDMITMPSLWEGFGLVALEAMSHRIPLVVSRASALPEIVLDGQTGLTVPPGDSQALAEALGSLLADPVRAAALGQAGYERLISTFTAERMIDLTLALYRDMLAGEKG